ncbi:hypothetical protein CDN99_15155 [Roseateles aquatilis]|uniref:Uncharacterized protein n=1 Tax=Roseateles aquatilis TaxID=431061 RepID=A0A246J855_9BURK|nr:hypothetical protein CDN99_15155 [Roseateles aquatilis]
MASLAARLRDGQAMLARCGADSLVACVSPSTVEFAPAHDSDRAPPCRHSDQFHSTRFPCFPPLDTTFASDPEGRSTHI